MNSNPNEILSDEDIARHSKAYMNDENRVSVGRDLLNKYATAAHDRIKSYDQATADQITHDLCYMAMFVKRVERAMPEKAEYINTQFVKAAIEYGYQLALKHQSELVAEESSVAMP